MSTPSEPPHSARPNRAVLRAPSVRPFLASRFFTRLGRSLLSATLAWHVWKLTNSYFWLGALGLVRFLPVIPVSLYAGALADLRDRRHIVLTTLSLSLVGAGALVFSAHSGAADELRAILLVCAGLLAVTTSFEHPAADSILPNLVPREIFASAAVISSNIRNVASVSGPVLMGVLTAAFGIAAGYALAATCLFVGLLFLWRTRMPERLRPKGGDVSMDAIREGIAFVRQQPAILGSMTLDLCAVIFGGATALLPVYADEVLGVGEIGYGLLSASMQIGTVSMAALLLARPPIVRPGRALLGAVLVFGLATIVFGFSRSFPLSLAAFIIAGMADQVSMVTRSVILQLSTPDALRGRVNSVNMVFIGASNELGEAESGFLAAVTSATFSVVAGGVVCLGFLGLIDRKMPELRDYKIGPPA